GPGGRRTDPGGSPPPILLVADDALDRGRRRRAPDPECPAENRNPVHLLPILTPMKSLLLKLLAGLTAIAALQLPVGYFLCDVDNYHFDLVQRALAPPAEALIFGDSVLGYIGGGSTVTLLELLGKQSPLPLASF